MKIEKITLSRGFSKEIGNAWHKLSCELEATIDDNETKDEAAEKLWDEIDDTLEKKLDEIVENINKK